MPNYLGEPDSVTSGTNNGGYTPNTGGGDTVNPLVKDIVPDVDITHDIGQPLKRMRTGYYSSLDVTNSAPLVLGVAVQAALAAGAVVLQDESGGFGFTSLKAITITRIYIQKTVLPALPAPRTVKVWQEPGTLLHTGSISNANDDGFNWYADVSWLIPAGVAIRYATDVPNGSSVNNTVISSFSPILINIIPSVRGFGLGVYPSSIVGTPLSLGNFRFTYSPDTPITYNGTPVALLSDLTDGDISITDLQTKTQYQSILDPNLTGFTDLYVDGELSVTGASGLGNTLVQGTLRCDQKQALFQAGADVTGNLVTDTLELPLYPDVGATLTTLSDKTQYLAAPLTGSGAGGSLFTGPLEVNGTSSPNIANRSAMAASVLTGQTFVTGMGFTPLVSCNITRVILQKSQVGALAAPRTVKLWLPNPIPASGGTELFSTTVDNTVYDATTFYKTVSWPVTAGTLYRIGFDVKPGDFINTLVNPVTFYSPSMTINTRQVYRDPFSSGGYPNVAGGAQYTELGNFWLDAPISALLINGRDPLTLPSLAALETKTQNQTAVANTTTFVNSLELKGTNTYVLKASTVDFEIERSGVGDIINYNATTANVATPIIRGLYIGPGNRPITSSGFTQTQDVTLTNSVAETTITGAGVGTLTIPANSIIVGSTSYIRGGGVIDSEGKGTETVTLRLKFNGTTVATFAVALAANLDAGSAWTINSLAVYKAGGLRVITSVSFGNTAGQNDIRNNTTLFAINTAVANTLSLTAQWSNANAANTLTMTSFVTSNLYQPMA